MPQPPDDPVLIIGEGEYSDYSMDAAITAASGIVIGDNPPYTMDDFLAVYPQFGPVITGAEPDDVETWPMPEAVLQIYINLASACLMEARWGDAWRLAMALFVAHFATLYMWSMSNVGDSAKSIAAQGVAKGILVSKSVGDVSASYQLLTMGWEDWGAWNLTIFGQQLITFANVIGMPGMLVW